MNNNKGGSAADRFFSNSKAVAAAAVGFLVVLFIAVFCITYAIAGKNGKSDDSEQPTDAPTASYSENSDNDALASDVLKQDNTTGAADNVQETTAFSAASTTAPSAVTAFGETIAFPSDTASWKLICLNKNRYVDASAEDFISLSYVAGSNERMDSRAAEAYERMYDDAARDGIYLTPCSGYRSYSTQKRLFYEFVDEYLSQGYSQSEAWELASRRRNPPGSSEHNIGICMDIICAASSANFQNTEAYAWLQSNAQDYGFILRYPEDKVDITGVKFEPWHWRYVGEENAPAIKNSGLCLEEYLGLA